MRDRTDESTAGHRPDADCGLAPAVTRGVDRRGLLKFAGATLALMLSPVGHAASASLRNSLLAIAVWLLLNAVPQSIAATFRGLMTGFGG